MFDSYLVEVEGRVAGILIRSGRGFAFHAVERAYAALEGLFFDDAYAAEKAALRLHRRKGSQTKTRSAAAASVSARI